MLTGGTALRAHHHPSVRPKEMPPARIPSVKLSDKDAEQYLPLVGRWSGTRACTTRTGRDRRSGGNKCRKREKLVRSSGVSH